MKYLTLPQSGPSVSAICLGVGGFGTDVSRDDSWAILDAFFERGGNFADSALSVRNVDPANNHGAEGGDAKISVMSRKLQGVGSCAAGYGHG